MDTLPFIAVRKEYKFQMVHVWRYRAPCSTMIPLSVGPGLDSISYFLLKHKTTILINTVGFFAWRASQGIFESRETMEGICGGAEQWRAEQLWSSDPATTRLLYPTTDTTIFTCISRYELWDAWYVQNILFYERILLDECWRNGFVYSFPLPLCVAFSLKLL